jgi:enoyl-CoA hydratase/carnithine racemase
VSLRPGWVGTRSTGETLYCDIGLATRKSSFVMPEPKRHQLSGPAFVHLSRMIPLGEAIPDEMAGRIMENSPLAVQFLKRIVKDGRDMTVDHHWKFAEMFAFMLQRTEDALEGPKAFAEKRKPEWKMR